MVVLGARERSERAVGGLKPLFIVGVLLAADPAGAEINLQKIGWQLQKRVRGVAPKAKAEEVSSARLEGAKLPGKLEARITLLNRGPKPAEGILLKYSVAARIAPRGKREAGAWAVPYMIGERRVPRVGANQLKHVPLDLGILSSYLLGVQRTGFAADSLKVQVMLEPHPGQDATLQTLENVIPLSP